MAITIPSIQQVNDFLASKGYQPSSKRTLYKDLGLDSRLGVFNDSVEQNRALKNAVATNTGTQYNNPLPLTQTPAPATNVMNAAKTTSSIPQPNFQAFQDQLNKIKESALQVQSSLGQLSDKGYGNTDLADIPQNIDIADLPQKTETLAETPTQSFSLENFGIPAAPSEDELIQSVFNSPQFKIFQERLDLRGLTDEAAAEAKKQELEQRYSSEKTSLENSLGQRGLGMSGIRSTQVKALADELAMSKLGVDRELASKILDADLDLRERIINDVADVVKSAKANQKEAIDQLNKVGLAVVGNKLVPTLEAQREERALRTQELSEKRFESSEKQSVLREERAIRTEERAIESAERAERRTQLAEETSARAEARFEQLYGTGRGSEFNYVRELMELNPNATRAELRVAAMENTNLQTGEIDSVLDTIGLTQAQATETAKVLVGQVFDKKLLSSRGSELKTAQEAAKKLIRSTGGVLKIGGRTVTLTAEQIAELESYIDTVTADEALEAKKNTAK